MSKAPQKMRRRKGLPAQRQLRARAARGALPEKLPLVHVTATGFAREIVESGQFEVRRCKVFNKDLVYFFVLRPAYRRRDGDEKSERINRFLLSSSSRPMPSRPTMSILSTRAAPTPASSRIRPTNMSAWRISSWTRRTLPRPARSAGHSPRSKTISKESPQRADRRRASP